MEQGGREQGKGEQGKEEQEMEKREEEIHSVERTQFCMVCSCVLNVHPGV